MKWAGQYGFLLLHLQAESEHQTGWHCLSIRAMATAIGFRSFRLSISVDCDMDISWRLLPLQETVQNDDTTTPKGAAGQLQCGDLITLGRQGSLVVRVLD